MRRISVNKVSDSEFLASLERTSSQSGEYFVVAAGGLAMLLVVVLFDMFDLLP